MDCVAITTAVVDLSDGLCTVAIAIAIMDLSNGLCSHYYSYTVS